MTACTAPLRRGIESRSGAIPAAPIADGRPAQGFWDYL